MNALTIVRTALRERRGITALEYGLIAALITVGIVGALMIIGPKLSNTFNRVATSL